MYCTRVKHVLVQLNKHGPRIRVVKDEHRVSGESELLLEGAKRRKLAT